MTRVTREAIARRIERGEGGGVFFLHGDESHLKEEAAQAIVDAHLDPATSDFNLDQLRGGEVDAETLASMTQTPPMMAEWRVVVVSDAQEMTGSSRLRAVVESLLDSAPPGLCVVLVADIPERSTAKFYKRLIADAKSIEFRRLSDNDLPGWLIDHARENGLEMSVDAARALAGAMGPQLGTLVREMDKLRDYVGDRGRIELDDVEAAVGRVPHVTRWAWFDAVGDRDFARARAELPDLLAGAETGVGLVIGLGNQMLRIMLACVGGKRALEAELPPRQRFLAGRVMGQARGWKAAEAHAALQDLLRADRMLKSGGTSDQAVIEELLLRLESRGRAEAA